MMNEVVVVDCELIRRLREEGLRDEAKKLVDIHQKNLRQNFVNGRKEIHNQNVRERRRMYIKFGLCSVCGKKRERLNVVKCNTCGNKHKKKVINNG